MFFSFFFFFFVGVTSEHNICGNYYLSLCISIDETVLQCIGKSQLDVMTFFRCESMQNSNDIENFSATRCIAIEKYLSINSIEAQRSARAFPTKISHFGIYQLRFESSQCICLFRPLIALNSSIKTLIKLIHLDRVQSPDIKLHSDSCIYVTCTF